MNKTAKYLIIAGVVVWALDAYAGMQASSNSGQLPSWYASSLGTIEGLLPVSLPLVLIGGGIAWNIYKK